MANELINGSMVAFEALRILNHGLNRAGLKRHLAENSQGYRMFDLVHVRRAVPFLHGAVLGSIMTATATEYLAILDSRITCELDICNTDLALSIDRFAERHLVSKMETMAAIMTQSTPETYSAVIAEQEIVPGMEWSNKVRHPNEKTGIRLARWYDIHRDRKFTQIDVLFGCCPA